MTNKPTGGFDASQFAPEQTAGMKHPTGNFPATISATSIEASKDQQSGMFVVEFTTPAGTIVKRYGLWHSNPQTVEIANKQLSALCHATGIFKLDWQNDGAALRNARCTIEVGDQIDRTTKQPNGYVEVKKVFDVNGVEPGKAPQTGQQQSGGNAGWSSGQSQQQNNPPAQQQQGWGNNAPQQQQPQPPANQGWQQNQGQTNERPPWAK